MQSSGSNFPEISSFPKILLSWLCWIYGILVRMRLVFYQKKLLRSLHPGIPVISVGNLTVGGTGKTPMV
ncbi:MAG: tetraacyldisaccharide 4'-kinase, partial [SAR324 cluster bacterium]|nr:tetraacyldisaccharide 4'-kinase [SAR324 cluster bacterium]